MPAVQVLAPNVQQYYAPSTVTRQLFYPGRFFVAHIPSMAGPPLRPGEVVPVQELLGPHLLTKLNGKAVPLAPSALEGKYVGLYFSAHWCPPCRGFTPQLSKIYEQLTKEGKPFEIVFISSDSSESSFDEYYGEMPWAALQYSQAAQRAALSKKFGVSSIPTLAILSPDGRLLSRNARGAVLRKPSGFPWEGEEDSASGGLSISSIIFYLLLAWIVYNMLFKK